jgi:hypothetical protein
MNKLFIPIVAVLLITACTRLANQEYLQAARAAVIDYEMAIDSLDIRIEMLEDDPQFIDDHIWKEESLRILDDLQAAGSSIRDLPEATEDLRKLDRLLILAADEATLYVDAMTTAINERDIEGVESARAHRETIGQYMDDAQNELIKINAFP